MRNICLALILTLAAAAAWADERAAIIIANRNYDNLRDVGEANAALTLSPELRRQGFEVLTYRDLAAGEMAAAAGEIAEALEGADRVLVFVAGQIASDGRNAWLLPVDAGQPGLLVPGQGGLSLGGLADLMAAQAGAAVLLVGEGRRAFAADAGIRAGFALDGVPQGVTVVSGGTAALAEMAEDALLAPGTAIAEAVSGGGLTASGFVPRAQAFLPVEADGGAVAGLSPTEVEELSFLKAREDGSEAALTDFLDRFPDGANASAARGLLAVLQLTPEEQARQEEAELGLTREERREIQANLTLIGHDTRGVDGVFGRGTRAAIAAWQAASGNPATGYLDRDQIAALEAQALEERERIERADAAFWRQTGALGTEAGYRAYLNRYGDGLFSDIAREELETIEEERRAGEAAAEAVAWEEAQAADTADAYRDFLAAYPDGAHADDAAARLEAIEESEGQEALIETAQEEERRLMGTSVARLLLERRLLQLGYDTGNVDGQIDRQTRRALRRYQRNEGLTVTGFADQATVNRLLQGN